MRMEYMRVWWMAVGSANGEARIGANLDTFAELLHGLAEEIAHDTAPVLDEGLGKQLLLRARVHRRYLHGDISRKRCELRILRHEVGLASEQDHRANNAVMRIVRDCASAERAV